MNTPVGQFVWLSSEVSFVADLAQLVVALLLKIIMSITRFQIEDQLRPIPFHEAVTEVLHGCGPAECSNGVLLSTVVQ